MKFELEIDAHNGVGPYSDLYGHDPVTVIQQYDDGEEPLHERFAGAVFVCFDCGYTANDPRLFMHEDCDRDENQINQTWREAIGDVVDLDE